MTDTRSIPDKHQQSFRHWVHATLAAGNVCCGHAPILTAISGDAGFRNYYRVAQSQPALLAVDAPPATEKNQAFCHIARLLRQHGIHAPQVYAVDFEQGFLLIEDLGGSLYEPLLMQEQKAVSHPVLYQEAEQCLLRLHRIPVADAGLAAYDADKLRQEMQLFPEWFVKQLLKCSMATDVQRQLEQVFDRLIASALEQPQVVVHRDFHCRNLLKIASNSPGVIDFQDGVIGAITYDLVSLYRDCYIKWPAADVVAWVEAYRKKLLEQHVMADVTQAQFQRWFDWMGLQRHIKVLGIFARLFLRDHKPGYLKDLPLVIHYTLSVAKRYPEFSGLVSWFERDLLPAAKSCDWYREITD